MNWPKIASVLAVLGMAGLVLGGLVSLATGDVLSTSAGGVVLGVVVLLLLVLTAAGIGSATVRETTYW